MDSTDLSSSLAIVAIPSQEDYVWNISSEKVPHMTLLFLGDQSKNSNIGHIVDFVEHVANTSMNRFGLSVDRRGLLGPKDADVLFFENDYCTKMVNQARGDLLKDPYIKTAYDSVEQYPSWTPHLTLGYPETPAKPDERDYPGFNWVNFDRIAVWTGDYEGPTFDLKKNDVLEMSDKLGKFLEHHGVKGMKWGVRQKDDSGTNKLQTSTVQVDPSLAKSTQVAGIRVASLMGERYGFDIREIKSIPLDHPEHDLGLMGYVENTPGRTGNTVYANRADIRKTLKDAEKAGWFANDCGTPEAFFTHESAHALFHAEQKVTTGFLGGVKTVGGNIKARDKALEAAAKEANKAGIPNHLFATNVSGYARADGSRQETEAELFAQYHWSPNPPKFVKVWGETLHKELGVDSTPFREKVVMNV